MKGHSRVAGLATVLSRRRTWRLRQQGDLGTDAAKASGCRAADAPAETPGRANAVGQAGVPVVVAAPAKVAPNDTGTTCARFNWT